MANAVVSLVEALDELLAAWTELKKELQKTPGSALSARYEQVNKAIVKLLETCSADVGLARIIHR